MNTLQGLLQDSLISTGNVENCAIIRRKDVSLRASSAGFSLSTSDMEDLIEAFKHPISTRDNGILLDEVIYKCVRADKFSIYGKKGGDGLVLVRSATLLLVGTYTSEMYPSICVEAVEKLADYFREKGK